MPPLILCLSLPQFLLVERDVLVPMAFGRAFHHLICLFPFSSAQREGKVTIRLLWVARFNSLLRVQVQRDRDHWENADIPGGKETG